MQPFNLALALGSAIAIAGVERPRRLIEELLIPGVNLIGVDLKALVERPRRLIEELGPNRPPSRAPAAPPVQSSPSTPRRSSVLFSASFSAPSAATERPEIQLVNQSQIPGPLQNYTGCQQIFRQCRVIQIGKHTFVNCGILNQGGWK